MTLRFQFVRTTTRTKFESCSRFRWRSCTSAIAARCLRVCRLPLEALGRTVRATMNAADEDSPLPIGAVDETTASMPTAGRPRPCSRATTAATREPQPARGTCPDSRVVANDRPDRASARPPSSSRSDRVRHEPAPRCPCADRIHVPGRRNDLRPGELSVVLSVQLQALRSSDSPAIHDFAGEKVCIRSRSGQRTIGCVRVETQIPGWIPTRARPRSRPRGREAPARHRGLSLPRARVARRRRLP